MTIFRPPPISLITESTHYNFTKPLISIQMRSYVRPPTTWSATNKKTMKTKGKNTLFIVRMTNRDHQRMSCLDHYADILCTYIMHMYCKQVPL